MSRYTVDRFERYFPTIAKHACFYTEVTPELLHIELDDGMNFMYDDLDNSITRMPDNKYYMTEGECRQIFAWRLRRVMRHKCVSQLELAEMTGIHEVSISNYMNGKTTPSFYAVDRIAKALDISMDELRYA